MVEVISDEDSQGLNEQKKIVNNSEHILHRVIYEEDSLREDFAPIKRETATLTKVKRNKDNSILYDQVIENLELS